MGDWFKKLREGVSEMYHDGDDKEELSSDNIDRNDKVKAIQKEQDNTIDNKDGNKVVNHMSLIDKEYQIKEEKMIKRITKKQLVSRQYRLQAIRKLPKNTLKRYVLLVLFYGDKLPLSISEVIQLIESLYRVKHMVITQVKYAKRGYHWYIALYLYNASRHTVKSKLEELFKGRCSSDGVDMLSGRDDKNNKNVYVCTYYRSFGTMLEFITEYGINKYLYRIAEEDFVRYLTTSLQKKKQNLGIHNRVKVEIGKCLER